MKICINHISFSPSTPTITIISYFGLLLASIIFTLVLFISSSKIQLIQNEGRGNPLSSLFKFQ
uniref:Cytochrome b6-f complex subunit 6 n=4 Tax=Pinus mugo TaxID=28528 RepID=A0A1J0PKC0_PINMU|nr:cytochrome b6/f complex subunit VI [Pinus mugo]APD51981.1 cytochrome b6/f complex subunit VI [Pinus mugo subsp. rotundata]QXJ42410.1 cytochrome b6/f complex subunit VI [Pinus mugo subsp. uncinata]QXJ42483.1 cytochrome b6/f complex subunit VI [Pinus mugo subsp. rotundata]QXJ42556.1 cytochrome b6/f complex subunit VI [Pinus mugo subsp. mugo]